MSAAATATRPYSRPHHSASCSLPSSSRPHCSSFFGRSNLDNPIFKQRILPGLCICVFFLQGPCYFQQGKNKLWIMVSIIHSSMNECKIYFDVIIFLNKALQWLFFKYECTFATHTVHNRLVHKLFDFFLHKMAYIGLLCQFFFTCRCKYISLKVTYTNNSEYY